MQLQKLIYFFFRGGGCGRQNRAEDEVAVGFWEVCEMIISPAIH